MILIVMIMIIITIELVHIVLLVASPKVNDGHNA